MTDRPVHVELDHRLRFSDGFDLSLIIGVLELLLGDVGCELDDFVGLAVCTANWIVGRLDIDFPAPLAEALVLRRLIFSGIETLPEVLVFGTRRKGWIGEHAVMLTFDLIQGVAHDPQKQIICMQNGSIHVELDNRLRLVQGIDDRAKLVRVPTLRVYGWHRGLRLIFDFLRNGHLANGGAVYRLNLAFH